MSERKLFEDIENFLSIQRNSLSEVQDRLEPDFATEAKAYRKKNFMHRFLMSYRLAVKRDDKPVDVADKIGASFEAAKNDEANFLKKNGAFEFAKDASEYSLEDLESAAGERIDFLESQVANYGRSSSNYRRLELEIRKMEIIKRSAYGARNLSKD